ncbi:MAG: TIGR01777 family oxidoreductase [Bacteroidetes bacterium]|nr:TIGR01777 family oxidoreductase [Bacteroidota bacterium]
MSTILITGGTGMVGTRLTEILLEKGHEVIILSRNPLPATKSPKGVHHAKWDLDKKYIDPEAFASADHIIHLAGAGVADKRWNAKRKAEILNSRAESGALLVHAMQTISNKIQSVHSASGIGWYGADTIQSLQTGFIEEDQGDDQFLGETCKIWEENIQGAKALGKRLTIFRIGIVLSNSGGALVEFKKPIRFGFAAILGNGKQNISWIHIDDLCQLFLKAIDDTAMQGVYNAVAPETVTNKQMTLMLAKSMRGRFFIPIHVPAFLLQWVLGEMSIEVLKSAKVNSFKTQGTGFKYQYPFLSEAIKALIHPL